MVMGVMSFIGFFLWFMISHLPTPVPHIIVNGQECIVQHVTDHCTSTGACSGHDVAVCPTEK